MAEETETNVVNIVKVVSFSGGRLEHFNPIFTTVKGKLVYPGEDPESKFTTLEKRYELMFSAAVSLCLREGCYTDKAAELILRAHPLTRFPLVQGDAWEEWFLSVVQAAYEEIIKEVPDEALSSKKVRCTYRYKTNSFYAQYPE